MPEHLQIPTTVIPQSGAGLLMINTGALASSLGLAVAAIREKTLYIYATAIGGPVPLQVIVNVAPVDVATAYAPLGPVTVIPATSSIPILWRAQSGFCRVDVQAPGLAPGTSWTVQAVLEGASE